MTFSFEYSEDESKIIFSQRSAVFLIILSSESFCQVFELLLVFCYSEFTWVVSLVILLLFSKQKELASKTDCPRMCAYKLVTVKFKWFGLQTKVENFIHDVRATC